ncbi:unnamed protein product [Amoebophrya sp. A120]|nr:unnamed protein product [Amoebophrya sp. A120]|eukprot:GSA120T00012368001.1
MVGLTVAEDEEITRMRNDIESYAKAVCHLLGESDVCENKGLRPKYFPDPDSTREPSHHLFKNYFSRGQICSSTLAGDCVPKWLTADDITKGGSTSKQVLEKATGDTVTALWEKMHGWCSQGTAGETKTDDEIVQAACREIWEDEAGTSEAGHSASEQAEDLQDEMIRRRKGLALYTQAMCGTKVPEDKNDKKICDGSEFSKFFRGLKRNPFRDLLIKNKGKSLVCKAEPPEDDSGTNGWSCQESVFTESVLEDEQQVKKEQVNSLWDAAETNCQSSDHFDDACKHILGEQQTSAQQTGGISSAAKPNRQAEHYHKFPADYQKSAQKMAEKIESQLSQPAAAIAMAEHQKKLAQKVRNQGLPQTATGTAAPILNHRREGLAKYTQAGCERDEIFAKEKRGMQVCANAHFVKFFPGLQRSDFSEVLFEAAGGWFVCEPSEDEEHQSTCQSVFTESVLKEQLSVEQVNALYDAVETNCQFPSSDFENACEHILGEQPSAEHSVSHSPARRLREHSSVPHTAGTSPPPSTNTVPAPSTPEPELQSTCGQPIWDYQYHIAPEAMRRLLYAGMKVQDIRSTLLNKRWMAGVFAAVHGGPEVHCVDFQRKNAGGWR